MNRFCHIRRLAGLLMGLAGFLGAFGVSAPAALATHVPPPGGAGGAPPPDPVTVPATVVAGGMPGWQIALIAVGAALLAATLAVLVDRALARRHRVTAAA